MPQEGDGLDIIVRGPVLIQIEEHMAANPLTPCGGVVIGNASPKANLVLVTAALPVDLANDAAHFGFTDSVWQALVDRVSATYRNQRIVGWYHSRPGQGVYMSHADRATHSTLFSHVWQVAYVYDHEAQARGFFGWSGPDIVRVPSWEVTNGQYGIDASVPVDDPAAIAEPEPAVIAWPERGADIDLDGPGVPVPGSDSAGGNEISGQLVAGEAWSATSTTGPVAPFETATRSSKKMKQSTLGWLIAAGVAAVVVAGVVINSGNDVKAPAASLSTGNSSSTGGSVAVDVSNPSGTDSTSSTGAQTTTPVSATSLPATASGVVAPAARPGGSASPCAATGKKYSPTGDCFVPLPSGNLVVYKSAALGCADPDGTVLAPAAKSFTVGTAGDPLAITADGALVNKCSDLSYAKKVMAAGANAMAGLCGSTTTTINEAATRCFAMNPETGAMVAIVKSATKTELVAACSGATSSDLVPLTWSISGVQSIWRVESVAYDPSTKQFTATATRQGATATAPITCT